MSIVKVDEMKMFLEQTVGPVPSPESLYDAIAFPIEQAMLMDVRFCLEATSFLIHLLTF